MILLHVALGMHRNDCVNCALCTNSKNNTKQKKNFSICFKANGK